MANPIRPIVIRTSGNVPAWFKEYQQAVDLWTRDMQRAFEELQDEVNKLKDESGTN